MNNLEIKVLFAAIDKFVRPANAITEASRKASKALKETKEAQKGLENQSKLIESFRSANKQIGITGHDLEKARDLVKKLALEMNATAVPTAKMQRALAQATEDARNLAAQANRLAEKKQRLRLELSAVGIDTKKLSEQQRDLKSKLDAASAAVLQQEEALGALNKRKQQQHAIEDKLSKLRKTSATMARVGTGLLAAGTGINAAAAVPVLAYAKAEDAATQLRIAMMLKDGAVSSEFKAVNDMAMKLGTRLPGTAAAYQDMMTTLIRQGMPAKNILGGLGEATAYLSVLLKMAPTDAAEFASKLQDATRATDKEMMGLMDTIQRTFYLGVKQDNMLQGFAKLSPALSIIKKEGAEAAKVLAPLLVMTDQAGMDGSAAGNAYRKIFQLSLDKKKVGKGNAELAGTGVALDFSNGKGEFGGMEKMYAQLEKLRGVNTMQRLSALKKIFGDDAETLQALSIMIEKGAAGYADVQSKMEKQADLQKRVNEQLGTLKNLWEAAAGTFETAMVRFGESIAPELHATTEWLGTLAERLDTWAEKNPELASTIMHVVKWTGLAALGFGGLLVAISAISTPLAIIRYAFSGFGIGAKAISLLTGAFGLLKGAFFAIGRLLMANPLFAAIAIIAAAAYVIYENWEPIKKFFSDIWDGVSKTTKLAWGELKDWFGGLADSFMSIGSDIVNGMIRGIESQYGALKEAVTGMGSASVDWLKEKLGIHSPSRVFEQLGAYTMQGFEQGLLGNTGGALSAMGEAAKKIAAIGAGVAISAAPVAATAGQNKGGDTYQITIQRSAGDSDAELVAKLEGMLQRIQMKKQANARSRLRDTE